MSEKRERNPKPPPRGIIVLDTNTLIEMANIIDEKFLTEEARQNQNEDKHVRLIDALTFLSAHGFKVMIPEMVAIECNGFLRNGSSIVSLFPRAPRNVPFFKQAEEFLRTIKSLQRQGCDIEITRQPEDSEIGKYIDRLNEINSRNDDIEIKRKAVILAGRSFDTTYNLGDRAAHELIEHLKKCMPDPQVPIFYLSDDRNALDSVACLSDAEFEKGQVRFVVHKLNHVGLINALSEQGLLTEALGTREDLASSAPEFVKKRLTDARIPVTRCDSNGQLEDVPALTLFLNYLKVVMYEGTGSNMRLSSLVDHAFGENTRGIRAENERGPFMIAMEQLRVVLLESRLAEAARHTEAAAQSIRQAMGDKGEGDPASSSRVKRFQEKWPGWKLG